jgi:hypothetical protein
LPSIAGTLVRHREPTAGTNLQTKHLLSAAATEAPGALFTPSVFGNGAADDQAGWDASTPDPTLTSMSSVSRSSSPPITVVMAATATGYHSPL